MNSQDYFQNLCTEILSRPINDKDYKIFSIKLEDWKSTKYAENIDDAYQLKTIAEIPCNQINQSDDDLSAGVKVYTSVVDNTVRTIDTKNLKEKTIKYSIDPIINQKICIRMGDITKLKIDAIVNAANETLLGGGGIDESIHKVAGPLLLRECATLGGCSVGDSKITKGYDLPSNYVIHSVGPVYFEYEKDDSNKLLAACYESIMNLCLKHKIRSVALCAISTGFYGFPLMEATEIACRTIRDWLQKHVNSIDRIVFNCFIDTEFYVYQKIVPIYFPVE